VDRLNRITAQDPATLTEDDREFLEGVEDHRNGQFLFGRYGMGYYTPEEKARVDAARAERKKAREQAATQAAKAELAEQSPPSDPAPGVAP